MYAVRRYCDGGLYQVSVPWLSCVGGVNHSAWYVLPTQGCPVWRNNPRHPPWDAVAESQGLFDNSSKIWQRLKLGKAARGTFFGIRDRCHELLAQSTEYARVVVHIPCRNDQCRGCGIGACVVESWTVSAPVGNDLRLLTSKHLSPIS